VVKYEIDNNASDQDKISQCYNNFHQIEKIIGKLIDTDSEIRVHHCPESKACVGHTIITPGLGYIIITPKESCPGAGCFSRLPENSDSADNSDSESAPKYFEKRALKKKFGSVFTLKKSKNKFFKTF